MAIFTGLPGVKVTVLINGITAVEYDDTDEVEATDDHVKNYQASRTVSKYIESGTGQEFAVMYSINLPYKFDCEGINFHVYVDGQSISGKTLRREEITPRGLKSTTQGYRFRDGKGGWKLQKLKFAAIETTTDEERLEAVKTDASRFGRVGEILVLAYRVCQIKARDKYSEKPPPEMQNGNPVHEKALKGEAKSHGTVLGDAQVSRSSHETTSTKIDGKERPIAIFKFKYRSFEALQSLLIIPREPCPEINYPSPHLPNANSGQERVDNPDPELVDLDTVTPEERRMLARMLSGFRNQGAPEPQIKAENQSLKRGGDAQARGESRKKFKLEAGVIDLTED